MWVSCVAMVHRKRHTVEDTEDEGAQSESSGGDGIAGSASGSDFSGGESKSSEDLGSEVASSEDEEETPARKPKQASLCYAR